MLFQSDSSCRLLALPLSLLIVFLMNCSSFSFGLNRKSFSDLSVAGVIGFVPIPSALTTKVLESKSPSSDENSALSVLVVALVRSGLTFSVSFHHRSLSGRSRLGDDVSNDIVGVRGFIEVHAVSTCSCSCSSDLIKVPFVVLDSRVASDVWDRMRSSLVVCAYRLLMRGGTEDGSATECVRVRGPELLLEVGVWRNEGRDVFERCN